MATPARTAEIPTLWFWKSLTPTPVSPLTTTVPTPFPAGASHCAWKIGVTYISAVPNVVDQLMGSRRPVYRMELGRTLYDDQEDFGYTVMNVPIPDRLDAAAMAREGKAILSSSVQYQVGSYFPGDTATVVSTKGSFDPPFNNATVAMLVLVAGMRAEDRREFRKKYFRDENYDWRSGRSPFNGRLFSTPEHVYQYCLFYKSAGYP